MLMGMIYRYVFFGDETNELKVVKEEDENTKRGHKKKEPFWTLGESPFNPVLALGHKLKELAMYANMEGKSKLEFSN